MMVMMVLTLVRLKDCRTEAVMGGGGGLLLNLCIVHPMPHILASIKFKQVYLDINVFGNLIHKISSS